MKTLGEKIKNIRKLNKLNQTDFASAIGVSQGTLSELEKDKYKPSLETVIALKLNFDVDLDWLLLEGAVASNRGLFCVRIDDLESNLISGFRKLSLSDKQEIEGIVNLKLKRYSD
ncbi:helix-turn-helix transcriptional regulator [Paenibacillus kribbensis]|uniref:helix-turn-helix domain-containing protein n=1 Tax=Paenibacillus kribbensis TaxID=172713 RepID=UPI002DB5FA2E|nr:helix-turn-helix transcriptional regulator [Paenibacillus kribbensis]MEC0236636.1 helix-turn-helix transcriptional regulator [Paenibacillus kribbensis]